MRFVFAKRSVQLVAGIFFSVAVSAADQSVPREYFGFHAHRLAFTTPWPSVPFGSLRLWDAYATWPYLEPKRGTWTFSVLDKYVALAEQHKVELLLPLGLSPTWASARPDESSAYHQPGWAAEPANLDDWRNYVRTVAIRLKGKIRYYEIWNEPNLTRFFSGSVAKMIELTCEAARAIKRVDPTSLIVSPSATEKDKGVQWLRSFMEGGGSACIDVVGFHFYTYAHEGPETMVPIIRQVRDIAHKYGKRAVWNTETGWYFANRRVPAKTKYRVQNMDEAAAYIVRAFVIGASMGLERFFWYSWDNQNMGGLIEPDTAEPKPAVGALQTTLRWLVGARLGSCSSNLNGVWVCPLEDDRRGQGWIAWNPGGRIRWTVPEAMMVRSYESSNGKSGMVTRGETVELEPLPTLLKASVSKW